MTIFKKEKGLTLVVIFLSLFVTCLTIVETLFLARLVDFLTAKQIQINQIYFYLGFFALVGLGIVLFYWINGIIKNKLKVQIEKHLRSKYLLKILNLKLSIREENSQKQEFYLLTKALEQYLEEYLMNFFNVLTALLTTLSILITITVLAPITISYILPLLLGAVLIPMLFNKKSQEIGEIMNVLFEIPQSKDLMYLEKLLSQSYSGNNQTLINLFANDFKTNYAPKIKLMGKKYSSYMFFTSSITVLYYVLTVSLSIVVMILQPTWISYSVLALILIKANSIKDQTGLVMRTLVSMISTKQIIKNTQNELKLENLGNYQKAIKDSNYFESLNVSNLNLGYDDLTVFENLNLQINKGDKILITGASGSGKSTLLKFLTNLKLKYSAENILLDKKTGTIEEFAQKLFVMGNENIFLQENILNNLTMLDNNKEELAKNLLNKLDLSHINLTNDLESSVKEFSQGEGQRLMIIKALLTDKPILIFDETLSNLDTKVAKKVLEVFKETEKTIIVVSHTTKEEEAKLFNKHWKIEEGKLYENEMK
ncbi:ATP-binding cassette domain-containing protein [Mycoplasma buteonis]|uniref:ATP-binding cassette domain-containing protein n=1 Tax=Mycoplasma buteonis TaxID=171280 RepID=UPI00055C4049|nr:ABC transporter ATP-binding protein [Mycoplasma buteonis]